MSEGNDGQQQSPPPPPPPPQPAPPADTSWMTFEEIRKDGKPDGYEHK